jgi:hypothetical protein
MINSFFLALDMPGSEKISAMSSSLNKPDAIMTFLKSL